MLLFCLDKSLKNYYSEKNIKISNFFVYVLNGIIFFSVINKHNIELVLLDVHSDTNSIHR